MSNYVRNAVLGGLIVALLGCSGVTPTAPAPEPEDEGGIDLVALFSGELGNANDSEVNKYLWGASLDLMSQYRLLSTDPFTGVIVTDWITDPGADERLRLTVRFHDKVMTTQAIEVVVFRQVQEGGQWQDAAVQTDLPATVRDAILTRARQLRLEDPVS